MYEFPSERTNRGFDKDRRGVDKQHANHDFLKGMASNKCLHNVERIGVVKRRISFKPGGLHIKKTPKPILKIKNNKMKISIYHEPSQIKMAMNTYTQTRGFYILPHCYHLLRDSNKFHTSSALSNFNDMA